ncbi:hypothetical protein V2J09_003726 [Rumex salicifolius]
MPSQSPVIPISENPPSPPPMVAIKSNTPSMDGLLLQKVAKTSDDFIPSRILISQPSFEEDRPLLSRAYSYDGVTATPTVDALSGSGNRQQKQRRRRTTSHDALLPLYTSDRRRPSSATSSFRENVGHAASETYLVTGLSLKLLRFLGVGYRWMTKFLALGCYAMLLMPGFIQVGYYYFFSTQVQRSIVYGGNPRNRLDLYLPKNMNGPKPVVAFVTGGAWIIGYKAWGSLLGRHLCERDIIVACIDYRWCVSIQLFSLDNFVQGT